MIVNEVKKVVEQVVRLEYIAEDGEVFATENECELYEKSALFALSKKLRKISKPFTSIYELFREGYDENELEIFDIQTNEELEYLRRYLYLKATLNGANDNSVRRCFKDEDNEDNKLTFDDVTIGHEVIVCWSYDKDYFWIYGDGSLEGYCAWLKENMKKCLIEPTEE